MTATAAGAVVALRGPDRAVTGTGAAGTAAAEDALRAWATGAD